MTKPVADGLSSGDGANRLPAADTGVASPDAKDQQNQPQANEDTFTKAQVDALIAETKEAAQKDIGAVRSDLMKAQNLQRAEWEKADGQYQQRIHDLTVKDMDKGTRDAYEAQLFAERNQDLTARLRQTEEQLALSLQMGEYVKQLSESFGVPIEELDMSSMDRLSESAWEAAERSHQDVLRELTALKAEREVESVDRTNVSQDDLEGLPEAPDVVVQQGSAPTVLPSLLDLRKKHSADQSNLITEDELFTMAENPELTGVDLNVVIQALAAEADNTQEE